MANWKNGNSNEMGYNVRRMVFGCNGDSVISSVYIQYPGVEECFSSVHGGDYLRLNRGQLRSARNWASKDSPEIKDVPVKESGLVKQLIEISKRFKPGQSSPELTEAVKKVLDGQG